MLRKGKHHSPHLQHSWAKYGDAAIEIKLIVSCAPKDLLMYEQRAMDILRPEFNVNPSARNRLGAKRSADELRAWSERWGAQQREMITAANRDPARIAKAVEGRRIAYAEGRVKTNEKVRWYKGIPYTLTEAAKAFGMDRDTLRKRLGRGFTFEDALDTPVVRGGPGNRAKKA